MEETTQLPVTIVDLGQVYQDRNQSVHRVVATFDGFTKEYFVSDHGVRVAMVVVRDGCILLTRQFRLLINGISLEIPGGKLNDGESPEDGATRECFEETGVRCLDAELLVGFHPSLDIWKNHTHVIVCTQCEETRSQTEGRHVWLPVQECLRLIQSGGICDALSIIGILACSQSLRT